MSKKHKSKKVADAQSDEHGLAESGDDAPVKLRRKQYEAELEVLQGELVAMQEWVRATGARSASCSRAATLRAREARSSGSWNE